MKVSWTDANFGFVHLLVLFSALHPMQPEYALFQSNVAAEVDTSYAIHFCWSWLE